MSPFMDYKRRRTNERSWLLPDSRCMWFLQLAAAIVLGYGFAVLALSLQ